MTVALRRRLIFAALYFGEGAPIGYVWWALPTRLREAGVPIEDVTRLAALVTLPWALKFLWAPVLDVVRPRRFGLRAWIVSAQVAMGLTLLPVGRFELPGDQQLLLWLLLVHAFCAATQDVAIDALAVASVPAGERGAVSGWMQVGMLAGRATFGGLALALEQWVSAATVIHLLVGTMWVTGLAAVWAVAEPMTTRGPGVATARRFAHLLATAFSRGTTWIALACALLAGAAMEATGAVTGPLLIDRGFSAATAGRFFAGPAVLGMGLGALLGGRLSDRARRATVASWAVVILAGTVGCVAGVATVTSVGVGAWWLLGALAVTFVAFGVLTASLYALLMEHTDPALGATQFSAYMGAINAGTVWSTWLVGRLASGWGYPAALGMMSVLSLLALPPLAALRSRGRSSPAGTG